MPYAIEPLEHGADCYCCKSAIPAGATNWGYMWGSDGSFPDGASSMIACWDCHENWQEWCREAAEMGESVIVDDEPKDEIAKGGCSCPECAPQY